MNIYLSLHDIYIYNLNKQRIFRKENLWILVILIKEKETYNNPSKEPHINSVFFSQQINVACSSLY